MTTPSAASGETAAIGGYRAQFDYFAEVIYDALVDGSLTNIHIADATNGILDDISYETEREYHAAQMKHSGDGQRTFTYKAFKALFPRLVRSWVHLRQSTSKKVIPYLIVDFPLSVNDSITHAGNHLGSFADFAAAVLPTETKQAHPTDEWQAILEDLHSKLEKEHLAHVTDFWKVFRFCAVQPSTITAEHHKNPRIQDILNLFRCLQEISGNKFVSHNLTAMELIKQIGWGERLKSRFNHHPLTDTQDLIPMDGLRAELGGAITTLNSGYIFIEGCPGSGKSTFLSFWANSCSYSTTRYLAFDFIDRTPQTNSSERGCAETWLHDLIVQLRKDFPLTRQAHLPPTQRQDLLRDFRLLLDEASKRYRQQGKKHLIIIDGLDHVPREYTNSEESFLRHLPQPQDIPPGVIIILGSQYFEQLESLRFPVLAQYREPNRRLRMRPFTAEESTNLLRKTLRRQLSETEETNFCRIAAGHPLYTRYIIQELNSGKNPSLVLSEERPEFSGNIEAYYDELLRRDITANDAGNGYLSMLHLFARCEREVKEDFINEWGMQDSLDFLRRFTPLFSVNEQRRTVRFFHNSFRQYILRELTRRPGNQQQDAAADIRHYSRLADMYLKSVVEPRWAAHNALYRARRFDDYVSVATANSIMRSLEQFRPIREARLDAERGLQIAAEKADVVLLVRYLLTLSRLQAVNSATAGTAHLYRELHLAGYKDEAWEIIEENIRNRYNTIGMLRWAAELHEMGDESRAKQLFEELYPADLYESPLRRVKTTYEHCYQTALAWVSAAACFLPPEQIRKIHYPRFLANLQHCHHFGPAEEEASLIARFELEMALSLLSKGDFAEMQNQIPWAELPPDYRFELLRTAIAEEKTGADHHACCTELLSLGEQLGETEGLIAAVILDKAGFNDDPRIEKLIRKNNWAIFSDIYRTDVYPQAETFSFLGALYQCRLKRGISETPQMVAEAIPGYRSSLEPMKEFMLQWLRVHYHRYLHRRGLSVAGDFETFCKHYADLYRPKPHPLGDPLCENAVLRLLPAFYRNLMQQAAAMGTEALQAAAESLSALCRDNRISLSPIHQAEMIADAYEEGTEIELCRDLLTEAEQHIPPEYGTGDKPSVYVALGTAWRNIGDEQEAKRCFGASATAAFSIAYKNDMHMEHLGDWATAVLPMLSTEEQHQLIYRFTTQMDYLSQATEWTGYTAAQLADMAFSLHLSAGRKMLIWLTERGHLPLLYLLRSLLHHILRRPTDSALLLLLRDIYCRLYLIRENERGEATARDVLHRLLLHAKEKLSSEETALFIRSLRDSINRLHDSTLQASLLELVDADPIPALMEGPDTGNTLDEAQAQEQLLSSSVRTWDPMWGAGRLDAAEALAKAHHGHTDDLRSLFRRIAEDAHQEPLLRWHGSLLRIVGLTGRRKDLAAALPEWLEFFDDLIPEKYSRAADKPDLRDDGDTPLSCLVHLLCELAKIPNIPLHRGIVRLLSDMIHRETPGAADLFLQSTSDEHLVLRVALVLAMSKSPAISHLNERIRKLLDSHHFELRQIAASCLSSQGEKTRTTSAAPHIIIPARHGDISDETKDEQELLSRYQRFLKTLLPRSPHLYAQARARVLRRIRAQHQEDVFCQMGDRQEQYRRFRLGLDEENENVNPSYLCYRDALMHIISELINEGQLTAQEVISVPNLLDLPPGMAD